MENKYLKVLVFNHLAFIRYYLIYHLAFQDLYYKLFRLLLQLIKINRLLIIDYTNRIRKGLPSEAAVVARILPSILEDFFSPQEIMNKVIGEFLSNQQPHPQLMAEVLFKVFENLQRQSQQTAVTKWVMLSIGSFTQR